jgi:flagellar protein FlaG
MDSNIKLNPLAAPRPLQETTARPPAADARFSHHLESQMKSLYPVVASFDSKTGKPVNDQELGEAISTLDEHAQNLQRSLRFSVDESSGRTVVTVLDNETKEVIRQIPSEETLVIAKRLEAAMKTAVGVFVSEAV